MAHHPHHIGLKKRSMERRADDDDVQNKCNLGADSPYYDHRLFFDCNGASRIQSGGLLVVMVAMIVVLGVL